MQPKRSTIILDLNICTMFWERLLETECNEHLSALKQMQNKRSVHERAISPLTLPPPLSARLQNSRQHSMKRERMLTTCYDAHKWAALAHKSRHAHPKIDLQGKKGSIK
jgi:hypothetical protein